LKIGAVKWFNNIGGYGVIGKPGSSEVFIHKSNYQGRIYSLDMGDVLLFEEEVERGKISAKQVHPPVSFEDFVVIMSLFLNSRFVAASKKVIKENRWGKPYKTNEIVTFDVFELGLKRLCLRVDAPEMISYLNEYFSSIIVNKIPESFIDIFKALEPLLKKLIGNSFPIEQSYTHFGKNLNEEILFRVWEKMEFRLIGYEVVDNREDYEIPENILWEKRSILNHELLNRISLYSFGKSFCEKYIEWLIPELGGKSLREIESFSPYESIKTVVNSVDYVQNLESLNQIIKNAFITELSIHQSKMNGDQDYESFENLFSIIPTKIPTELKNEFNNKIKSVVLEKCSKITALQLVEKGKIDLFDIGQVENLFAGEDFAKHSKLFRLIKSQSGKKDVARFLINEQRWDYLFKLLEDYLDSCDDIDYGLSLSDELQNEEYWNGKEVESLIKEINIQIENIDDPKMEAKLFLIDYSKRYSKEYIFATLEQYSHKEVEKFLSIADEKYSLRFLSKRIELFSELDEFRNSMKLGIEILSSDAFIKFDNHCFENIDSTNYFELWTEGLGRIFPKQYILTLFNEDESSYAKIDKWLDNKIVDSQTMEKLMFEKLTSMGELNDRITFNTSTNLIIKLIALNDAWVEKIFELGDKSLMTILWFLGKTEHFDFNVLKQKFIYFNPESQSQIIKRLFALKAQGLFDFDIQKLGEIKRISLDIYKLNEKLNPEVPLDLSTDLLIEALKKYETRKKFLVEVDLITMVLQNLYGNQKRKFTIGSYFEKCKGRSRGEFNWNNQGGKIKKVSFGENKYYYKIIFDYNVRLVNEIKKIAGRKWNKDEKFWGVPSRSENEVIEFARRNRFFLDFEGSRYENNTHFAIFWRGEVPRGITFCEGRIANKLHQTFKKKFWWCVNQPCFENCETTHSPDEWMSYTFLDFCKILGLNLDENNKYGFFPNGNYYQFISSINRFNRLLERMYCRSCEHILYPIESSNFAAYTVTRFSCHNTNCSEHEKTVYLNHCLNGKCNSIIDSRDSKKCSYHSHSNFKGMYICGNCGSCCSHNMLSRRLENLRLSGGLIHQELEEKVNKELGHVERAEYYCYKCGNEAKEYSSTLFRCDDCDVEYDLTKFRLKHPHKHLRRDDYPRGNSNSIGDENLF
jgi:cold shock CspA family protein